MMDAEELLFGQSFSQPAEALRFNVEVGGNVLEGYALEYFRIALH